MLPRLTSLSLAAAIAVAGGCAATPDSAVSE